MDKCGCISLGSFFLLFFCIVAIIWPYPVPVVAEVSLLVLIPYSVDPYSSFNLA
jgi:hypothetical protein